MDLQLPLLDGYEATRHLKADPGLRAIPIIVITSYALSGDESRARAAGCGWSRQSAGPGHEELYYALHADMQINLRDELERDLLDLATAQSASKLYGMSAH